MASGPHTFVTANVFTAERFRGNRLAIVAVRGNALSQEKKQQIAREFGFSETVFLHDASGPGLPRRLDIFTENEEISFAGHPLIGAAAYILGVIEPQRYAGPHDRENSQSAILLTKAGPITVLSNPYRQVHACIVPHNVHIHSSTISFDDVLAAQPQLRKVATIDAFKEKTFPVVSTVKGMTFSLVDLSDTPEAMAQLRPGGFPTPKLDEEWNVGLAGCLYYQRQGLQEKEGEPAIHRIHQRVMVEGLEDPGTGSASCALGCYLALTMPDDAIDRNGRHAGKSDAPEVDAEIAERTKSLSVDAPREHYVFGIEQGVEMGRECQICVEVDVTEDKEGQRVVSAVMLSGRSTFITKGELLGVY